MTEESIDPVVGTGTTEYTLHETGRWTGTIANNGNTIEGNYTNSTTGSDYYTMTDAGTSSGVPFNETVTGSETFTATETGNPATQVYSRDITGSGGYTITGTGITTGSSSYSYETMETADARSGVLSQSQTGVTRYGILARYNDVSNTNTGNSPGNMNFLPYGQPWVDPDGDDVELPNAAPISTKTFAEKDYIGKKNTLVIITDRNPLQDKVKGQTDGNKNATANLVLSNLEKSGGTCNWSPNKDLGASPTTDFKVTDLQSLANAIVFYFRQNGGKVKFDEITIYGHAGNGFREAGAKNPGVVFVGKKLANGADGCMAPGKGDGLRFDLETIKKLKDAKGKNKGDFSLAEALQMALAPNGQIRIASCGYKYDAINYKVNPDEWDAIVKELAEVLGFTVRVAEGQPGVSVITNRFYMRQTNGKDTTWFDASPKK